MLNTLWLDINMNCAFYSSLCFTSDNGQHEDGCRVPSIISHYHFLGKLRSHVLLANRLFTFDVKVLPAGALETTRMMLGPNVSTAMWQWIHGVATSIDYFLLFPGFEIGPPTSSSGLKASFEFCRVLLNAPKYHVIVDVIGSGCVRCTKPCAFPPDQKCIKP